MTETLSIMPDLDTFLTKSSDSSTLLTERGRLQSERLLGLRIESRVLDESVDEDPHVALDRNGLNGAALFFLFT